LSDVGHSRIAEREVSQCQITRLHLPAWMMSENNQRSLFKLTHQILLKAEHGGQANIKFQKSINLKIGHIGQNKTDMTNKKNNLCLENIL
jgi:hypothetical protein